MQDLTPMLVFLGGTNVSLGRVSARAAAVHRKPLDPYGWQARFGRSQHRGNGFGLKQQGRMQDGRAKKTRHQERNGGREGVRA
jgi:hypothetical protein